MLMAGDHERSAWTLDWRREVNTIITIFGASSDVVIVGSRSGPSWPLRLFLPLNHEAMRDPRLPPTQSPRFDDATRKTTT